MSKEEGVVPQNPQDDMRQQPQLQKNSGVGGVGRGEGGGIPKTPGRYASVHNSKKNSSGEGGVRGGEGVVPQNPQDDMREQPQLQKKILVWEGLGWYHKTPKTTCASNHNSKKKSGLGGVGGGEGRRVVPQNPGRYAPAHNSKQKF